MRRRHTITFDQESLQPDTPVRPTAFSDEPWLIFDETPELDGAIDLLGAEGGDLELIDETRAELPPLPVELSEGDQPSRPSTRPAASAVPASQPLNPTRPQLPWGLGTDGWPRYNSRLVRLFACDPKDFVHGVIGGEWGALTLSPDWRIAKEKHQSNPGWPRLIDGTMQMPYRSAPLNVQLQVQPFHDRYSRVDIIMKSRHRFPRRYFDVASPCLTLMQHLERPEALEG